MSSISGTFATYNSETPLRTIYSNNIISPVAGVNPADTGYVQLPNVRGVLSISITSGDNSYTSYFDIVGGFGQFSTDPTQNWYPVTLSPVGCTVTVLLLNTIQIQTPVADAGGRTYIMKFFSVTGMGPQIMQTSVNIIGNNTLTVKIVKRNASHGW